MASKALAIAIAVALLAPAAASASTSDALNAVLAYDPARFDTLVGLHEAMAAPGEINVRGLRGQLRSQDHDRRWAATYIAHAVADDPPDLRALRPRLGDADPSIRALAAFGLAGNGSKRGLRVLVDLAGSRAYMTQSDLEPIAGLAEERLRLLTKARLNGTRAWNRWWVDVRRNIRWDRGAARYRWRREGTKASRFTQGTVPSVKLAGAAGGDAVVVPIKVQILWGPGVTSAQKRAIQRNLRDAVDLLNGDGRTARCKPIEFELDLVVEGDLLPDRYSIVVNEIPTKNKARWSTSWINHDDQTGRLWTSRAAGPGGAVMMAHEFGHIVGLPDEYYEYTTEGGVTRTGPVDPTSIMGSHEGTLLQRHLDFLSRLHDPDGGAACERWQLRFVNWTSQLDAFTDDGATTTNWLGLTAIASIDAGFWVDLDGTIRAAGYSPCGEEVTPGRTPHNPNGRSTRCPEAGGNSAGAFADAEEGGADCPQPGPSLKFEPDRFDTVVSGSRQGDSFSLRLRVDDSELAEAVRCEPAVEPGITKRYTLIRDGMRYAGALDFDMTPPSRDFRREEEHKRAFGQASLVRIEP